MLCIGFEPFVNEDSRMLILGSFPSVKSREEGFYYGNPQNRFWKILAESFGSPLPRSIPEKQELLRKNKIALWDMVMQCEIKGSMDKDIRNPVVADVASLLVRYPIRTVFTNGNTARDLLRKYYPQAADSAVALPSTSPANARLNPQIWIDALRKALL